MPAFAGDFVECAVKEKRRIFYKSRIAFHVMIVLSHFSAGKIMEAHHQKTAQILVSLDLGISVQEVSIADDGVLFPDGQILGFSDIQKIQKNPQVCFVIEHNKPKKIHLFSEATDKFYKLLPTGKLTPPTIEISGIRMHAVKNTNPLEDTQKKIESVSPINGNVLDTCTGLGYTAIMAANRGADVDTYDIDENVRIIASYNPWSLELFKNKNIHLHTGDISAEIKNIRQGFFERIIHDPPSFKIAPALYTQEFYNELYRVLKKDGILYHYIGSPGAKKGITLEYGIIKRLRKSGFIYKKTYNKGVVAVK